MTEPVAETTQQTATLPAKFHSLWPHQERAVEELLEGWASGARVMVLDAPTGSGKSVVAEAARLARRARGLYVATTKTLQEQFHNDFPYSAVVKGRDNYPTLSSLEEQGNDAYRLTAADCTKRTDGEGDRFCDWCSPVSSCPYEQAKRAALAADVAVLNTAYFLSECNGPARFSGRSFVVCDEADLLESELMRSIELNISPRRLQQLGLKEPQYVTKEEAWVEWLQGAIERVQKNCQACSQRPLFGDRDYVRQVREQRTLARLLDKLRILAAGLTQKEIEWIYTGRNGRVSFKPISVASLGSKMLWQHSDKFLLMSATIVSPNALMEDLGFDGNWSFVSVPSTFPKERRSIHFTPAANMSHQRLEDKDGEERERLVDGIRSIVAQHPRDNVLVHTVSYQLTDYLRRSLGRDLAVYSYSNAAERDRTLRNFTSQQSQHDACDNESEGMPRGCVLLAPSLDRGVDLPDDQCRVIVIAKIPYPYLGDRQIQQRLYGTRNGRVWYTVQTVRSIIQMAGRGMRHAEDHCVTYILDAQFSNLWNEGRRFFPQWFKEAVVWPTRRVNAAPNPSQLTSRNSPSLH